MQIVYDSEFLSLVTILIEPGPAASYGWLGSFFRLHGSSSRISWSRTVQRIIDWHGTVLPQTPRNHEQFPHKAKAGST